MMTYFTINLNVIIKLMCRVRYISNFTLQANVSSMIDWHTFALGFAISDLPGQALRR